jgi:hypothetical protein
MVSWAPLTPSIPVNGRGVDVLHALAFGGAVVVALPIWGIAAM